MRRLNIRNLLITVGLFFLWIILRENFSVASIVQGVVLSVACTFYFNKFLPLKKADDVNFSKLILFPFQMIGQIFKCAVYVIQVIFKGARVDIVEMETTLSSETLIAILGDTLTLTPGSVLLEAKGKTLTVLWLRQQNDSDQIGNPRDEVVGFDWLEDVLQRAEK